MSRRVVVGAVLLAAALVLPLALAGTRYASYVEHVVVQMMLMGLYAMAWDFLNGYVGMFSFGHAAFFGTGAYAAAILVVRGGVTSAPVVLLAALAASVVVGTIVGFLAARVGSVAIFLVTFACAEALYLLVLTDPRGVTNGDNGLPGVVPAPILGVDVTRQLPFYYVVLVVVVLAYVALVAITRSQFGQVLLGIRENEVRVRFAGYHVEQYKTAAVAVSAFFAGLAGALNAFQERIASPETLGWAVSGDAVLYATLGGTGTLLGPILGAGIVIIAREVLSDVFRSWLIFIGATYIVLVFFLPNGLYPVLFPERRRRP
ncbi:MAG: branched-chain amino acid ABC transporter permease [Candidatus Rokubacteria bacterium]|nr:branched-chain amino acid ABC transporter permease [Candidatus Rokubacteria bacterium]